MITIEESVGFVVEPEKEREKSCSAASWVEKNPAYVPFNLTAI